MKHCQDKVPIVKSDQDWLMIIGGAVAISADRNKKSTASAHGLYFS